MDLDFQDYTPANSGSNTTTTKTSQESHITIPPSASTSSSKQNLHGSKSILNVIQNFQTNQSQSPLSDEVVRQLMWASGIQKNKQQRVANSAGWGLGYFAQYFDITTRDVLQRILWSAVPIRKLGIDLDELSETELSKPLTSNMASDGSLFDVESIPQADQDNFIDRIGGKTKSYSYMERFIQSRPDLYGPFWISTTLIFAIAIFSNIISFLNYRAKVYQTPSLANVENNTINPDEDMSGWHYSMDELNTSASIITFYVLAMPTFLWFTFWFRGCAKYYTLSETICAYGYSLSIFIPLSALLMVQTTIFRYLVLIIASSMSGLVLMMSFLPTVKSDPNASGSHIILLAVPACQFGLAYIVHRIMLQ